MWFSQKRTRTSIESRETPRQQEAQQPDHSAPVIVNDETAYHHYRKMVARQTQQPTRNLSKLEPS
jgi:hypothetical protein